MFKVDNKLKTANVPRTVRFTEPLFEQLNQIAQDNRISFNHLVLQCCQYALEHMDENEEQAKK